MPVVLLVAAGLSTVAIDLPTDTPSETVERVVDSCNAALGSQRCEKARVEGNDTTLFAVVRFDGAALDIRLLQGDTTGTEIERRRVTFSEGDSASDRFIAAGLMVAALTAAHSERPSAESQPSSAESQPVPAPVEPGPQPTRPPSPLHVGLDLALHVGVGLDARHPKYGGTFSAWWMAHSPRVGVIGGVQYLRASEPLDLTWTSGSLGLVGRLSQWAAPVSIWVSSEIVMQRASAAAERDGLRESTGVLRWGGRFGSRVAVQLADPLHAFFGWEVTLLRPGFEVRLADERVGDEGPLRFGVSLGLTALPFS